MKKRFIRWLLKQLGHPVAVLPDLTVYAVAADNDRLAHVTTNLLRARCEALTLRAHGTSCRLIKCVPVDVEFFE